MRRTRDYKETVVARIKRNRRFARVLCAKAMSVLREGETAEALSTGTAKLVTLPATATNWPTLNTS